MVSGATPERVVNQGDPALLEPFIAAARELEASGVAAITSACGFLARFQRELANSVSVPLYSSSLIQLPMVHHMLRADQSVGLLVASGRSLTQRHLAEVGAGSVPVRVAGMERGPEFREVILEGRRDDLDADRLGAEVLAETTELVRANHDIGAIVIECTDLVPFATRIRDLTGLAVFDIVTLTTMVHECLSRQPAAGRPGGRDRPATG